MLPADTQTAPGEILRIIACRCKTDNPCSKGGCSCRREQLPCSNSCVSMQSDLHCNNPFRSLDEADRNEENDDEE